MESQITQNTFCTYTGPPSQANITIFFISGNPGLISYYHPFLSLLAQNLAKAAGVSREGTLQEQDISSSHQIYGCSLGGFEIDADNHGPTMPTSPWPSDHSLRQQPRSKRNELYDLEDQIRFVQQKLTDLMSTNAATAGRDTSAPSRRKVILIGHSVGAYMAMEILRRHREDRTENSSSSSRDASDRVDFDIVGGVMLFPTVMDIAHSPSGQKLTKLLSLIPRLALVVGFFARLLTLLLPTSILRSLVRFVMKNPPTHALNTTLAFLRSRDGVKQALHMAADEMRTITSDKWTDDVWGVGTAREPIVKLFFYFGRNDHWVAERTRDEIIALRGREDRVGPSMLVCEEGLPHAFCLKHNDTMARKVADMVQDIRLG
ncbi:uncharacterized protein N7459_007929 [Penicillium hispanicum]|uniref:uncharacterized protein n=1 Tax=Penicillium hispanicum TaxID=1080232 RepID=UPI002541AE13|nr:uncharacterized protein N7459_007929 [Penicillium hispanicum]KAJ5573502.1 hypothetical protein N7459_007929 [Penicillium hispanicum]